MEKFPIARASARELHEKYSSGELSPTLVVETLRDLIAEVNPRLNAIVTLSDDAMPQAKQSEQRYRAGRPLGPLDGVPLVVKDCINVAGLPTSWGTELFRYFVPVTDEQPVDRLRRAGMIVMGKTNTPEFAMRGFTSNPTFGPTRNPWDLRLTSGGSSGGTVSAVAAGFAPIGLGSDAGGSIRRPAGFTGLVGLKPSAGRVPRKHAMPALVGDLDVLGPVAHSVDDLAAAFAVIAEADLHVPASCGFELLRPKGHRFAPGRRRILYVKQFRDSPVDHEVAAAVDAVARGLEGLGHYVETGPAPFDTTAFGRCFPSLSRAGLALATRGLDWKNGVSPEFQEAIAKGLALDAVSYLEALEVVARFRDEIAGAFERYDLIMTPSSATLPWNAEERAPATINGVDADPGAHSVFTGFANVGGCPAINIPGPLSRQGRPIGFQLTARFGADELLLRMAAQYENAFPWVGRRASVSFNEGNGI